MMHGPINIRFTIKVVYTELLGGFVIHVRAKCIILSFISSLVKDVKRYWTVKKLEIVERNC